MLKRVVSVVVALWALIVGGMLLATIDGDEEGALSQASFDALEECDRLNPDWRSGLDCRAGVMETATFETTYDWTPFVSVVVVASLAAAVVLFVAVSGSSTSASPASSVRERWAESWHVPEIRWHWSSGRIGSVLALLCSVFAVYWIWAGSVAGQQLSVQAGKNWQPTCGMLGAMLVFLGATGVATIVFFVAGVSHLVRKNLYGLVWFIAAVGSAACCLGILVAGGALTSACFD